ncbi:hypothetical protein [Gryllotalpicola koreensis]|uniref:Uncharacterized protein n=1 Tax=Gryllotalpicola koreensis TaxID=993086 RepID=A0ABP8A325_9MICO
MRVALNLPEKIYQRLVARAERLGTTVADIISGMIAGDLSGLTLEQQVGARVLQGMCDADIAAELSLTNAQVKDIRLRLKLKANPRPATWRRHA